jgi:hypothetical protein
MGRWNNHEESEIGTCSTRDDFFGKKGGQYKPLSEVDLTDIKKKAMTNMANRLIKKLIGLSFSWEEIAELSGNKIKPETVSKVDFQGGARGGNTDSPDTKKLRGECRTMLLKLNEGENSGCVSMLIKMTEFTGKDGKLHGKLKKAVDDFDKAVEGAAKNA